ncbi:MAG: DUF4157 domain-containing protein [Oscillibacter sp.]|nr:DUF4157 domain-containing protein [Oscillibacter sp.]
MSYTYAQKKRTAPPTDARSVGGKSGGAMESAIPNSVRLAMLEAGQTAPTAADKGHRVDLPEAMRAKMESSFGMDFSAVKLYESEMLGQTGAEAMAQGNEIAFAPGKLDFSSMEGQARLGHELSHVASQARGEVHGNGFLLDSGLETRADREGAMAARGESVYGNDYGGAVAPLSSASPASMDGPMQAKKNKKKDAPKAAPKKSDNPYAGMQDLGKWEPEAFEGSKINPSLAGTPEVDNQDIYWVGMRNGYDPQKAQINPKMAALKNVGRRKDADEITEKLQKLYGDYDNTNDTSNPMTNTAIAGLSPRRMGLEVTGSLSGDMTPDQIEGMYKNILAPHKKGLDKNDPNAVAEANKSFDTGMMQLKTMQYKQLKRLEKTYGTLGSQMHPEDFIKQAGPDFAEQTHFMQDVFQMIGDGGGKYFDFENNEQDKEYKRLADYFGKVTTTVSNYGGYRGDEQEAIENDDQDSLDVAKNFMQDLEYVPQQYEAGIGGLKMDKKALKNYRKGLKNRAKKGGWMHRLFGGYR